MLRPLLHSLLFFPTRGPTPPPAGDIEELEIDTDDGERLRGWWLPAAGAPRGQVLFCHGNAGNIAGRSAYGRRLARAGLDVLLFDYRGYGASSGRPTEDGIHRDARAALAVLERRSASGPQSRIYLGESLGAAVALALALEAPPAGVILQSAFTSVRDMARVVFPLLPPAMVPDAFPSLRLIRGLRSPLLVLHGDHDDVVPVAQGRALFAAAPAPKRIHVFADARHNDLLVRAGDEWLAVIDAWSADVLAAGGAGRAA